MKATDWLVSSLPGFLLLAAWGHWKANDYALLIRPPKPIVVVRGDLASQEQGWLLIAGLAILILGLAFAWEFQRKGKITLFGNDL